VHEDAWVDRNTYEWFSVANAENSQGKIKSNFVNYEEKILSF